MGLRMIRPPFQWAVALVCGLLVASLFHGSSEADQVTSLSQLALAAHPGLVRWREKLSAAEARQMTLARQDVATSTALRAALAAGTRVDTITVLEQIATADSTAFQHCSVAISACEQRAQSAETEADSLAHRLLAQVEVSQCKFFFLKCPSRTQSALVGLLVGAAAGVWATR